MLENKKELKIGIVLNYVNMGIGNLIPIFYTPIMLSLLGQNEYGLYKLSSSITSYLSLISIGLGASITRYLIKERSERGKDAEERMLGLFVIIFNIIAVITLLVGTVLTCNLQVWYGNALTLYELQRMKILVLMMVCNMALGFSLSPYMSIVTSHEKYLFYQCMNILMTCVVPILNLCVLYAGAASVGMATVSLAMSIVSRLAYQVYVVRNMRIKPQFRNLPINQIKSVLAFSFWIFLASVVGQLYNTTDTIMIGMIPTLATAGVAVYNIGIMLSNIIGNISTGVSSLLAPTVNQMVFQGADGEELTTLAIKIGRIQGHIAVFLISGFISFGQPFICFYAGEGYGDAYWVALWNAFPATIFLIQSVCLSIITAENRHQFRSIMYLFIATLNVVGTWYMMKPWGIVGAAAMTGLATIIGQGFMMNWYYYKKTNLNMKRFWREILPIFKVPVVMVVLTLLLGREIDLYKVSTLFFGIIGYSIFYLSMMWLTTLNKYEKNLILDFLHIKVHAKRYE